MASFPSGNGFTSKRRFSDGGDGNSSLRASSRPKRFRGVLRDHPRAIGSEPPYYRIAELYFEDMDQLQRSLGSEEGQATVADVQNFATGGVTFYFSGVDS
jgi:hypothetical protein